MFHHPLIVDLDGTLIHTDLLHESALLLLKDRPLETFKIPFLLSKGKALLKRHLAAHADLDPKTLPYNLELIEWLGQQKSEGRKLILCTASDHSIARLVADHLGIFDEIIASDGIINVIGSQKAEILTQRFDSCGYDYVGNSYKDLPVWRHARRAIVVNGSSGLISSAKKISMVEKIFPKKSLALADWRRMLRVHQWLKNLLLFLPLFAAHEFGNKGAWISLLLGFVSFSLCASAVYIANDLLDLQSDRQHPRKSRRPFASGLIPLSTGVIFAPILLAGSVGIASFIGSDFLRWLVLYFTITCAYSWFLKRLILIDCLTLAGLYTIRIVAGVAVVGHQLSFWLLAFSVFLFLSLAFLKRYAELEVHLHGGKAKVHGRGYHTTDAPLIQTMGIVSGYTSVLVLALYLNSDAVIKLYVAPELIWGAVPVMLYWISWMWIQAHRGKMHDDPLIFAMKDYSSLISGVLFAAILFVGAVGLSW